MSLKSKIIYTITDEAPFLATHSLLPIVTAFTKNSGISMETKDISLSGRILANFNDFLRPEQKRADDLKELGDLAKTADANIIKLPNISASMPQLLAAIEELQAKGFDIPDYPQNPTSDNDLSIKATYDKIKGSAVNPVLREGNSDRRAPQAVKNFAKQNPHSMGQWSTSSRTHVATMDHGDFFHNEQSTTITQADDLKVVLETTSGTTQVLKTSVPVLDGEIIDASVMSKKALISFLEREMNDAAKQGIMLSLHLKATMMKVSDPIIFGHAVKTYFKPLFEEFGDELSALGINVNNGLGDLLGKISGLSPEQHKKASDLIQQCFDQGADLAMVNSDKGITNLHVPSDVIIDASMPAMIRTSGKMWDKNGAPQDTKAIIPDSSYAGVYQATLDYCRTNGAFDPKSMGTVPNVGLMAQKAEEYGSHDKTFELTESGVVKVYNQSNDLIFSHDVEEGDIWRMCQVKDAPVENWVRLAIQRAEATKWPAIFWLDQERAHDRELIKKVRAFLSHYNTEDLTIEIMAPRQATEYTLDRVGKGLNTISVTGNVLRDYLTDLFPILELGTSAKMLSIVPLMQGGGLFETGAGGSAPKHVEQFVTENHLRWDSLGEFLALAVSLEFLGTKYNNKEALVLATSLDSATERLLLQQKSPSRKVNELDNRGSHFYLALYWAQALVEQTESEVLRQRFSSIHEYLTQNEQDIAQEFIEAQGQSVSIDGYYAPDTALVNRLMQCSPKFNHVLATL
ncbi:MAG: NADP-dependent isocitrate dehydrogenase [Flavobacteriaceae bacterium]|nr:NADP-dependent isocitrate dehydrogenase [Flavobacteriaceae bacterium]MDG1961884.1 NADP-dependent isocitrate dehydrogenase [Flavobacteriaceae bacterium]